MPLGGDVGRPSRGHVVAALAHVDDSRARARATVQETLPRWLGPGLAGYVPADGRPRPHRDSHAYARFLCETHAVGSPEECADRLAAQARETGAAEVILHVESAGDPVAVRENIARLGAEVLPAVRERERRSGEAEPPFSTWAARPHRPMPVPDASAVDELR